MLDKRLPMTGFEPRIFGVGGDCYTNWAHNHCSLSDIIASIFLFVDFKTVKRPMNDSFEQKYKILAAL